jgi:hypothetical protein
MYGLLGLILVSCRLRPQLPKAAGSGRFPINIRVPMDVTLSLSLVFNGNLMYLV